jgi:hypothetical protein
MLAITAIMATSLFVLCLFLYKYEAGRGFADVSHYGVGVEARANDNKKCLIYFTYSFRQNHFSEHD